MVHALEPGGGCAPGDFLQQHRFDVLAHLLVQPDAIADDEDLQGQQVLDWASWWGVGGLSWRLGCSCTAFRGHV